jgi:hypothetical protein
MEMIAPHFQVILYLLTADTLQKEINKDFH